MTTQEKLNQLHEFYCQRDLLNLKKQDLIATILTPDLRKQIADIETEFTTKAVTVEENIAYLEVEIKDDVLTMGQTVKGEHIMAVWAKGREGGWDNGKLKGFAMAHPEILAAKKPDGEPTVSLRKIG